MFIFWRELFSQAAGQAQVVRAAQQAHGLEGVIKS